MYLTIRKINRHKRKGQVSIDVSMTSEDKTELLIVLRGYGEVVSFIADRIDKEQV